MKHWKIKVSNTGPYLRRRWDNKKMERKGLWRNFWI